MVNGHNLNIVLQQMKGNLCYKQNCNNLHVLQKFCLLFLKFVQDPLTRDEGDMKVKEVISANGWYWSKVSFDLPLSMTLEIQATPYALAARSEDRMS